VAPEGRQTATPNPPRPPKRTWTVGNGAGQRARCRRRPRRRPWPRLNRDPGAPVLWALPVAAGNGFFGVGSTQSENSTVLRCGKATMASPRDPPSLAHRATARAHKPWRHGDLCEILATNGAGPRHPAGLWTGHWSNSRAALLQFQPVESHVDGQSHDGRLCRSLLARPHHHVLPLDAGDMKDDPVVLPVIHDTPGVAHVCLAALQRPMLGRITDLRRSTLNSHNNFRRSNSAHIRVHPSALRCRRAASTATDVALERP
jgi:hypothetical protein